jgi:putative ABC transport system permease protein
MLHHIYRWILQAGSSDLRRNPPAELDDFLQHCERVERARLGWFGVPWAWMRGVSDALIFVVEARAEQRRVRGQPGAIGRNVRRPVMKKQDIKATLRFVRSQPFMAGAIVLMLGLGIGATTAMFSVISGVLLKALPFPQPEQLVQVYGARPDRGWTQMSLTEANFWDLRDMNHTLADFGAWHSGTGILTGKDGPEQVSAALVSSGFFRALGAQPIVGRLFEPAEDLNGDTTRPVLLSYSLWVRRFGSDRNIVNQQISFSSGPRTVVGVLPAGTPWLDSADVYVPFTRRADANRDSFEYASVARIKDGVTLETALADLQGVSKQLAERYPGSNAGLGVALVPANQWLVGDQLRRMLWILLGAVGLLLVIASVNVTSLLLARASTRARERAVRAALGASRADLIRESLTESLVLSGIATVVGLLIAMGILRVMQAVDPGGIPRLAEVQLNGWMFGFATLLAVAVGVVTGLAPALQTPISDVVPVLRQGQRGTVGDRRHLRLRNIFVVTEVALSLMLLVGAGLLVRSLMQVLTVERGFETPDRLMVTVAIPGSYGEARIGQTAKDVLERVRALPNVASAAAVSGRILSRGSTGLGLAAPDQPDVAGAEVPWATWRMISTDYFKTIGLPILKGREFGPNEEFGKPMRTVISQRVADLFWPNQNPIGRSIVLWKGQSQSIGEVIGVVGNMRERGLEADPTLAVYFPGADRSSNLQLIVHTHGKPEAAVSSIRAAITAVDRNLPISNVRTLEDVVGASLATRRFTMLLLGTFAVLALVLALAGVYGVLAYAVARRTSEIGVRLALGARHHGLLGLVVAQGMRPVVIGLVLGLGAAIWLSRLMTSLLFEITPGDPMTYVIVSAALALTGLIACYLPARQVLRVDPVIALRTD